MAAKAKATKNTKTTSKKTSTKKPLNQSQAQKVPLPGAFDLFSPSVKAFMLNLGTFLGLFLLPFLVVAAGGMLAFSLAMFALSARSVELAGLSLILFVVVAFAALILGLVFAPAIPITQLKSVRGEKISLKPAVKGGLHYFWRYFGLTISLGIVITIGFILFIIPGIIFIRRYFLAYYFLIDQDIGVFESMRRSSKATKGNSGAIWGVIGVNFLISLLAAPLSFIPFVGSVAGSALQFLYFCAPAMRYEQLKDRKPTI